MNKEIIKPERVMYYEGSKMSFLEYVDKLGMCNCCGDNNCHDYFCKG
jgi:hypothetical protein